MITKNANFERLSLMIINIKISDWFTLYTYKHVKVKIVKIYLITNVLL